MGGMHLNIGWFRLFRHPISPPNQAWTQAWFSKRTSNLVKIYLAHIT